MEPETAEECYIKQQ